MKTGRLWVYRLVTSLMPETRFFNLKAAMLSWCGVKIGKNARICSSVSFLGIGMLSIGDDVWIGPHVAIESSGNASVSIGSHVDIANGVMITTGTHEIDLNGLHIAGKGYNKSVSVGDGSWIGLCARLLPGAKIGSHSVVAAGSVVTKSFDEGYVLLAGVPADVKKRYI